MILAKVRGNLTATQKNRHLVGHKLLLVHPIDLAGNFIGNNDLVALDLIDAGIGDTVLVVQEGDAVQQILSNKVTPVNTMVVAIIDDVELTSTDAQINIQAIS